MAATLARLIAATGKRVTLLDADFRSPAQHTIFGLGNVSGLSDMLRGASGNGEAYSQTAADGLRVVPSGPMPADPTILLESAQLGRWIERLRSESDVVIIDTPSALSVADALVIAGVSDAVLMVLRAGAVSGRDALRAKDRLAATKAPILGVVLNAAGELPEASVQVYETDGGRHGFGGNSWARALWGRWAA